MEGVINTDLNMGGQGNPNIFNGGLSIHFTRGSGLVIQTDFSMRGGAEFSIHTIHQYNTYNNFLGWG